MNEDNFRNALRSGIPAGVASLITLGGVTRQPLVHGQLIVPSKFACAGFGGAFALGTFMMIDGDYRNGSGFISVWSTLWLLSQRGKMFRGAYPATIGALATFNAIGYALEFQSSKPALTNIDPPYR